MKKQAKIEEKGLLTSIEEKVKLLKEKVNKQF